MNDLVSVCIPVYNGEKYLLDCLDSVSVQTYRFLEILIIDDGSTDQSVEMIKKRMLADNRIRLVKNDENLGLVKNWIKCIEEAKGTWIKFMFQDDTMEATCIEAMLSESIKNNVSICLCSRNFIIEENTGSFVKSYFLHDVIKLEDSFPSLKIFSPKEIAHLAKDRLFDNFLGEPITLLLKKQVFEQIGTYNNHLVQLVDYEFALRACLRYSFVFIPKRLVSFRTHSNSTTNLKFGDRLKILRLNYIEPLIMFHEYLFNPCFKLLRKEYGYYNLFKTAVVFYNHNSGTNKLSTNLKQQLFKDYKGLHIIKTFSNLLTLKHLIKH